VGVRVGVAAAVGVRDGVVVAVVVGEGLDVTVAVPVGVEVASDTTSVGDGVRVGVGEDGAVGVLVGVAEASEHVSTLTSSTYIPVRAPALRSSLYTSKYSTMLWPRYGVRSKVVCCQSAELASVFHTVAMAPYVTGLSSMTRWKSPALAWEPGRCQNDSVAVRAPAGTVMVWYAVE
jgi:hypothetical protein